jgi:hypothetical protein
VSSAHRGVPTPGRPLDRRQSCRGRSESRWSARSVARTYDLDCDLCAATGWPAREDRPVALAGAATRVRDGGDRQRWGAGLTALRQRPAPVRRRARGAEPACRPPAVRAPFHLLPSSGPPARSPIPSGDSVHAQSLADAGRLARRRCAHEAVEEVVTTPGQGETRTSVPRVEPPRLGK